LKRRLLILRHWLAGRKNGVGVAELMRFLFARRCVARARPFIEKTEESGDYRIVHLKGAPGPLYYPGEFDPVSLCQVITEHYCRDWHNYEAAGTVLATDDVVVDCGAAEGLFALLAAPRCKKLYAVEPLPEFVDAMGLSFKGLDIEIIPVALSDHRGEGSINASGISSAITETAARDDAVPVVFDSLDNIFFEKGIAVTYIKADLEGSELDMLAGARRLIAEQTPKIAITTYHEAGHARAISRLLREVYPGYNILVKGIEERAGAPVMLHAWRG